jgi:hypothetical protein
MDPFAEKIYVLTHDGDSWEDIVIYTTEVEAINASMKNPMCRVEVFMKNGEEYKGGYFPTYNYYRQGSYISKYK